MNSMEREREYIARLISDMVIAGATEEELADAIAYSRDVINAETDYKSMLSTSSANHHIDLLIRKYGAAIGKRKWSDYNSYK